MIEHSDTINELATALAKAQATMKGALRDSDNPFFKSRYADLASVWDACRAALTSQGIAVLQGPSVVDGVLSVTTLLTHASGQWARSTLSTTLKDHSPQVVGSATTYLRRYGLAAMVGVAPEDDDGNAAQGHTGVAQGPQQRGARREALQEQSRRANADRGPYKHVDTETGTEAEAPALSNFAELMARRAKLPAEVKTCVPTEEDMHAIPPAGLMSAIPGYIESIRRMAEERKLSGKELSDLREQFLGNRLARLDAKGNSPFFIYALYKWMDPTR